MQENGDALLLQICEFTAIQPSVTGKTEAALILASDAMMKASADQGNPTGCQGGIVDGKTLS